MKRKDQYPQDMAQLGKLIVDIATRDKGTPKKSSGKHSNTKTVKKKSKK